MTFDKHIESIIIKANLNKNHNGFWDLLKQRERLPMLALLKVPYVALIGIQFSSIEPS